MEMQIAEMITPSITRPLFQKQALKRATKGSGTLERLPSGKYRFRIRLPDGTSKWSEVFDTKEEARRLWKVSQAMVKEKKITPVKIVTLQSWGEQWLAKRTNRNLSTDNSYWSNHIDDSFLAEKPLPEISRLHIKDWLRQLSQKPALVPTPGGGKKPSDRLLSRQTQLHCLNLLRSALTDALEENLIKTNPANGLRVSKEARKHEGWTYLRLDEIEALLTSDKIPEKDKLLYQFAITTGMRQGELWGLRWSDIQFDGEFPHIHVCRSYKGPTKNGKPRKFPMFPVVREILARWREICPTPDGLVWPSKNGNMRGKGNDNGWVNRKLRGKVVYGHKSLAGITRHIRFHDLRHTCASHLVMGSWGISWKLEEICEYLAHSDIKVTQRYAHMSNEHLQSKASQTTNISPRLIHAQNEMPGSPTMGVAGVEPATFGFGKRSACQFF